MLTIYRRHYPPCKHAGVAQPRRYRNCHCPLWVQGSLGSLTIKRALDLRSWQAASELVRDWEAAGEIVAKSEIPTIADAVQRFLADAKAQNLGPESIRKYGNVLGRRLLQWCAARGFRELRQLGVEEIREFRRSWPDGPNYAAKNLERLRTFFRFCELANWIERNPARAVKPPKFDIRPTLPFTEDEVARILSACDQYRGNRDRIRALVLLLRYSGLRIGDALSLSVDRITSNRLFLYTAKTGTPVYVPLPGQAIEALGRLTPSDQGRFFTSGRASARTARSNWSRYLNTLFTLAGVAGGHSHRFRDTFAVRLLEKGVPLETVSVLLGHSSVKITERHYRPWVQTLQQNLEAAVARTWELRCTSGHPGERVASNADARGVLVRVKAALAALAASRP